MAATVDTIATGAPSDVVGEQKEEKYILDSPEEVNRLAEQHDVIKDAMGGLIAVPLDFSKPGLRILDSGTADGYWLRDLQTSIPSPLTHTYIGTDISHQRFPARLPPGITLITQSITEPWPKEWHNSFDLVHQRLTLAGAGSFPLKDAVKNLVELVKPSGWIQLVEAEQIIGKDDGLAMQDFLTLIKDVFTISGAGFTYAAQLQGWLKEAGVEDVHERLVDMYLGANNPTPDLAAKGSRSTAVATAGLVSHAKAMPKPTSFSNEQLDNLTPRLEVELAKQGGYYPLRVVWGRKPRVEISA